MRVATIWRFCKIKKGEIKMRSIHKKMTHEDKFERKWWVHNKAKRTWVRWMKKKNNKEFRKKMKGGVYDE